MLKALLHPVTLSQALHLVANNPLYFIKSVSYHKAVLVLNVWIAYSINLTINLGVSPAIRVKLNPTLRPETVCVPCLTYNIWWCVFESSWKNRRCESSVDTLLKDFSTMAVIIAERVASVFSLDIVH